MIVLHTMNGEGAILNRILRPEQADLSPDAARSLLRLAFGPEDRERMRQLSALVQEQTLSEAEQAELDNYRRVSRLLDLIHSKARLSLKRHASGERDG